MKKALLTAVIVMFFLCFPTTSGRTLDCNVPAIVRQVSPAVAYIETEGGSGTGFIISLDGTIITAYHVVKGEQSIRVRLLDGRDYPARVVKYDEVYDQGGRDLALLKIDASNLPTVALGDSDSVEIGTPVIAIGYPIPLGEFTVTDGIISAILNANGIVIFQTSAPLNLGNSGGPLLNCSGEVIGINFAKIDAQRFLNDYGTLPEGIAFATPINIARNRLNLTVSIDIGAVLPFSGGLQAFGPKLVAAAAIAIDEVNQAGGLLGGNRLALEALDSGTSFDKTDTVARQLVEYVEVILGETVPSLTKSISLITIPKEVVLISPSASSGDITTLDDNDFVFRTAPSDNLQGVALADLAKSRGYQRISIIARNNAYGVGIAEVFKQEFERQGGVVISIALYDPETANFSEAITTANTGSPDAISLITYDEIEALITQMVANRITKFDLFVDGSKNQDLFDHMANLLGTNLLEGKVGTALVASSIGRGYSVFETAYRAKLNEAPFVFTPNTYDAMALISLAIEKAGQYNGRAIRNVLRFVANPPGEVITVGELGKALELLRQGRDINYEGASGSVDFDSKGDVPGRVGVWKISSGKIVETTITYQCSPGNGNIRCARE